MTRDTHTDPEAPTDDRATRERGDGGLPSRTRRQFLGSVGAGAIAATAATTAATAPAGAQAASRPFVETDGTDLVIDGETVYFHGANNFWITDSYRGTQERIDGLFSTFDSMGIDLVRTFVACEGGDGDCYIPEPYTHSEGAYETLDYLIASAADHGIRLVLVLADNWDHNGGAAQYVDWTDGASVHGDFYANEDVKDLYRWHVEETLTRENTITGLEYREDPTIAVWELCNEPRIEGDAFGEGEDPGYEERASTLETWITEMAALVKDVDPNHLVSTGTEGFYTREERTEWFYSDWTGQDFLRLHALDDVDLATFHWYPYHWNVPLEYGRTWIEEHVRDAHEELGKPAYLGEFNVNIDSGLETRNEFLSEWYEVADAYDCNAVTIWQIVRESMHDHDGFQVYRSESGDVLGEYREAARAKSEVHRPADDAPFYAPNSAVATSTGSSIRVDWSAVRDASEYVPTIDGSSADGTTRTHATFDGLDAGTEYDVGASAVGPAGEETDATTVSATTEGPETVDAPAWEYGTVYEEGDRVVHNGVVWEAQWYTDQEEPRFESGYAWTFVRVVASPIGLSGGTSPPEPPAAPASPSGVTTDATASTIELGWEAVSNADHYNVSRDGTQVAEPPSTTYTFTGLSPDTTYAVGLEAENDAGTSTTQTVEVTTDPDDGTSSCGDADLPSDQVAEVDGQTVCDVDGDGYYRDVTGDGSVGQGDVAEFFTKQHRSAWKQPELFDFSGNDAVTHGDVVELFDYVALN